MELNEIALTQLELQDPTNDIITNVGNIPMPQGTTFNDLVIAMPHTFYWGKTSFGLPKPCMLRIVPESVTIGASTNSVPYDVPCNDFTLFSLFVLHRHPDHRPK